MPEKMRLPYWFMYVIEVERTSRGLIARGAVTDDGGRVEWMDVPVDAATLARHGSRALLVKDNWAPSGLPKAGVPDRWQVVPRQVLQAIVELAATMFAYESAVESWSHPENADFSIEDEAREENVDVRLLLVATVDGDDFIYGKGGAAFYDGELTKERDPKKMAKIIGSDQHSRGQWTFVGMRVIPKKVDPIFSRSSIRKARHSMMSVAFTECKSVGYFGTRHGIAISESRNKSEDIHAYIELELNLDRNAYFNVPVSGKVYEFVRYKRPNPKLGFFAAESAPGYVPLVMDGEFVAAYDTVEEALETAWRIQSKDDITHGVFRIRKNGKVDWMRRDARGRWSVKHTWDGLESEAE